MAEGEVTRRLTTIVAVDVSGYSLLMGADAEGTLSLSASAPFTLLTVCYGTGNIAATLRWG